MSETDTACLQLGDNSLTYTNGDVIARGGFGVVWKAVRNSGPDKTLIDQSIAVKEIHLRHDGMERLQDDSKGKSVLQRWKSLFDLRHPNVLRCYQITIGRSPYGCAINLAMEFVAGSDLLGLILQLQRGETTLKQNTILDMTEQLADGLNYLHQNDIIHGDLKPANVLKKPCPRLQWTLIIADLEDRVQMEENVTQSVDITQIRGTARYMSPEMVARFVKQGCEKPGRKTDVWSLGCIVLDLADCLYGNRQRSLSKNRLFSRDSFTIENHTTREQIIIKIAKGCTPVVSSDIPSGLADIIGRCLVANVAERISADALTTLAISSTFTTSRLNVDDFGVKSSPNHQQLPRPHTKPPTRPRFSTTPNGFQD